MLSHTLLIEASNPETILLIIRIPISAASFNKGTLAQQRFLWWYPNWVTPLKWGPNIYSPIPFFPVISLFTCVWHPVSLSQWRFIAPHALVRYVHVPNPSQFSENYFPHPSPPITILHPSSIGDSVIPITYLPSIFSPWNRQFSHFLLWLNFPCSQCCLTTLPSPNKQLAPRRGKWQGGNI